MAMAIKAIATSDAPAASDRDGTPSTAQREDRARQWRGWRSGRCAEPGRQRRKAREERDKCGPGERPSAATDATLSPSGVACVPIASRPRARREPARCRWSAGQRRKSSAPNQGGGCGRSRSRSRPAGRTEIALAECRVADRGAEHDRARGEIGSRDDEEGTFGDSPLSQCREVEVRMREASGLAAGAR